MYGSFESEPKRETLPSIWKRQLSCLRYAIRASSVFALRILCFMMGIKKVLEIGKIHED